MAPHEQLLVPTLAQSIPLVVHAGPFIAALTPSSELWTCEKQSRQLIWMRKNRRRRFGFFFSVEPVPQTISQWQRTCWWWPRAGGSSEKGKGLLKKSEITMLLGVALQPELESVTEKLKHGPLWILKLLTSGMSGLIKFPFRQQWKLPELYFIHSVKYGIQCFNQPEIKSSFQSTELSCRQEILLLTNQVEIKSNDEYNLAFLLLHLDFHPRQ